MLAGCGVADSRSPVQNHARQGVDPPPPDVDNSSAKSGVGIRPIHNPAPGAGLAAATAISTADWAGRRASGPSLPRPWGKPLGPPNLSRHDQRRRDFVDRRRVEADDTALRDLRAGLALGQGIS